MCIELVIILILVALFAGSLIKPVYQRIKESFRERRANRFEKSFDAYAKTIYFKETLRDVDLWVSGEKSSWTTIENAIGDLYLRVEALEKEKKSSCTIS